MTISDENKKFLEGLLQYYIDQADSYNQFANEYSKISSSKREMAFGIIVGTIYSAFLQTYSNQQLEVRLDDIQEFHDFIRNNIDKIINALNEKNL
jgi:hypothetical protein|tara:strand:- start:628 stop:912 length:285 start_codon:yes stop_codon:yes gene_type:complete